MVVGWKGLPVYDLSRAYYTLGVGADFLGGWASLVWRDGAHDAIGAEQRYIEPVNPRRHFLLGRSTLTFRLISLVKTFSGYDRS